MSFIQKIVLSLVVIAAILTAAGAVLRMKLEPLVKAYLIESVATSTNQRYSLEIADLNIQLLRGGFSMADVRMTSDSTLIRIRHIEVCRIQVIRFLRENTLAVGSVLIESATIDLVPSEQIRLNESEPMSGTVANRMYEALKPILNAMVIEDIDIRNAGLTIRNQVDGYEMFNAHDVDIRIRDVVIDSTRRPIEDIRVDIASVSWNLANNLYRIQSRAISVSAEEKRISVAGFKFVPLGDHEAFVMTYRQQNRIEFEFDQVDITDWDTHAFFHDGKMLAGAMSIQKPALVVSHDKRLPPKPIVYRKLMHLMLYDIPIPLNVEQVTIASGLIHYRHRHQDHDVPGLLRFEQLDAELAHVGNLGAPDMSLHVETVVMGEGHLTVDAQFNMLDASGRHTVKGVFSETSFAAFNPVLENIVFIRARSGYLKRMEFDMELNDVSSFGSVTMDYENVTIQMIGDMQRFRTFMANRFVINQDHTGDDSTPEAIAYTRLQNKNIFHYWWMSLLSGLGKTLGLA